MLADWKNARFPIETALLVALCFFLPLLEAPKNLTWLAYVACWLVNRVRARDFGGRWDLWDTLIAAWIASGFVVAAFAGLHGDEWHAAFDIVRYGAVLWLVKRAGYSAAEIRWVLGSLVVSTLLGLFIGYYRMWSGIGQSGTLQLHSVGHVNHTAIYIAIMLGLCTAWLFARWHAWRTGQRAVALAATVLVLVSLVVTASRGAIGAGLALLPLLGLAWRPRWRTPIVVSVVAVAIVAATGIGLGIEVVRKHEDLASNVLSFRDGIWRVGLIAWERFPWFGVGIDNYVLITPPQVKEWRSAAGKEYEPSRYIYFPHAHSLYINTLVERGVFGAAILGAALLAWLAAILRRPPPQAEDLDWILWGAAAGAWFVTTAVGLVNTTLHHEHAILAVLLLGLWLSRKSKALAS